MHHLYHTICTILTIHVYLAFCTILTILSAPFLPYHLHHIYHTYSSYLIYHSYHTFCVFLTIQFIPFLPYFPYHSYHTFCVVRLRPSTCSRRRTLGQIFRRRSSCTPLLAMNTISCLSRKEADRQTSPISTNRQRLFSTQRNSWHSSMRRLRYFA